MTDAERFAVIGGLAVLRWGERYDGHPDIDHVDLGSLGWCFTYALALHASYLKHKSAPLPEGDNVRLRSSDTIPRPFSSFRVPRSGMSDSRGLRRQLALRPVHMETPPPHAVRVTAPSRLHFGMLSVHPRSSRQFGGVGAMVAEPGLRLSIGPSERLQTIGPLAGRAMRVARHLLEWEKEASPAGECTRACRIEIHSAPREHVGLGTGTQLSMAVAAGLAAFWGRPPMDAVELARRVGRGLRSAVGLYGFVHGGLVFESGKAEPGEISPLAARSALPEAWRFVLLCPRELAGLSGEEERRAFDQLPPVPPETTAHLERLARESILPAAEAGRFHEFSEAVYEFGYKSGMIFAPAQGGAFAGPRLEEMVRAIRALGVRGVGQSSWGPTLFALLPDQPAAEDFVRRLATRRGFEDLDVTITAPDNGGARVVSGEW